MPGGDIPLLFDLFCECLRYGPGSGREGVARGQGRAWRGGAAWRGGGRTLGQPGFGARECCGLGQVTPRVKPVFLSLKRALSVTVPKSDLRFSVRHTQGWHSMDGGLGAGSSPQPPEETEENGQLSRLQEEQGDLSSGAPAPSPHGWGGVLGRDLQKRSPAWSGGWGRPGWGAAHVTSDTLRTLP